MLEAVCTADLDAAIVASIPKWPNTVSMKSLVADFGLYTQARVLEAIGKFKLKHISENKQPFGRMVGIEPDSYAEARRIGEEYMDKLM